MGKSNQARGGAHAVLRCSFCNKTQADVRKVIAGPSVYICDECVEVCNDIIADDARFQADAQVKDGREASPRTTVSVGPRQMQVAGSAVRCALCRFPTPIDDITWIPNRGGLCPGCIGEIEATIAEKRQQDQSNG